MCAYRDLNSVERFLYDHLALVVVLHHIVECVADLIL